MSLTPTAFNMIFSSTSGLTTIGYSERRYPYYGSFPERINPSMTSQKSFTSLKDYMESLERTSFSLHRRFDGRLVSLTEFELVSLSETHGRKRDSLTFLTRRLNTPPLSGEAA